MGARGCILPIKWVKTYLGPDENPLGTNGKAVCAIWGENFFEKNAFFWSQIGPNPTQNGPKGDLQGGLGGQFWVFEAPRPFGTPKKINLEQKKICEKNVFFGRFWVPIGPFCM